MTPAGRRRKARTFARARMWWGVAIDAVLAAAMLVLGIVGSSYLVLQFGVPHHLVPLAVAVVLLPLVISIIKELYLMSMVPGVMAEVGLDPDALGSASTAPTPKNPTALLEFELRMVERSRPFAWARVAANTILTIGLVVLAVAALLYFRRLPGMPMVVLYAFASIFLLGVINATVSDIYGTWAIYAIPLDQKTNVVVTPIERILLVTRLGIVAAFFAFVVTSRSPRLIVFTGVTGIVIGVLIIRSYRQTVSHPIVNPIDITPITIDSGETIAISVAGVTLGGGRLFQKVGFGRWLPQQGYEPRSGRKLNPWAQNALLVSETRLYFIFVPMGLGEQQQGGASALESLVSGKYIRAKLDEMLRTMTLSQIYQSDPINFAVDLSDVGHIEVLKSTSTRELISFADRNGDELRAFVDRSPELDQFEAFVRRVGLRPSAAGA